MSDLHDELNKPAQRRSREGAGRKPKQNGHKPANSPRWQLLNSFVDFGQRQIPSRAVRVWLAMFRKANRNGVVQIGVEEMAKKAGVEDRTIFNALRDLEDAKFIHQTSRGNRNKGVSRFQLLPIPTCTPIQASVQALACIDLQDGHGFSTRTNVHTATCTNVHSSQKEQDEAPTVGRENRSDAAAPLEGGPLARSENDDGVIRNSNSRTSNRPLVYKRRFPVHHAIALCSSRPLIAKAEESAS